MLKGERVVIIGLSLPNIYLEKFFNENVLIIVILEAYIYNKAVKKYNWVCSPTCGLVESKSGKNSVEENKGFF